MSYVDAFYNRDADIINIVERDTNGKRQFKEYPARYVFYYADPRGKYQSIYGDQLQRVTCKNVKDFHKEQKIYSNKKLFESDVNPIFRCLEDNYLNQDPPKLNVAFLISKLTSIQSVDMLLQKMRSCQLLLSLFTYNGWIH